MLYLSYDLIINLVVNHILQGTKVVEGLTLKLPRANEKCFSTKAFKKMKRLRLLQLAGVQLDGDFEYLSRNLRWLSWNGFPLKCIPTSFYQENLVSIELVNSNVKFLWKEAQVLLLISFFIFVFVGSYHLDVPSLNIFYVHCIYFHLFNFMVLLLVFYVT